MSACISSSTHQEQADFWKSISDYRTLFRVIRRGACLTGYALILKENFRIKEEAPMSDTQKRYRAVRNDLKRMYAGAGQE
jgi:hypothetical protein